MMHFKPLRRFLGSTAVVLSLVATLVASHQVQKPVRIFFVRHAETGPKPKRNLSKRGELRAEALAQLLGSSGVTHLFSTNLPRTLGTLAPLAAKTKLPIQKIAVVPKQFTALRALPDGAVAVVAGHSNTVPRLVKLLGGQPENLTERGWLREPEHDRLFVLTIRRKGRDRSVDLLELRYGNMVREPGTAKPSVPPVAPIDPVQVGASAGERKSASIFLYSKKGGSLRVYGQYELTYGSPPWRAEHDALLSTAPLGSRFRLGNNFFTTFDTSCAVRVGGVRLEPGSYYLALQQTGKDKMGLVFLNPEVIRKRKWNASQSSRISGGVVAPLAWKQVDTVAERLTIEMSPKGGGKGPDAVLQIRFGPHELTVDLEAVLGT